MKKTLCKLLSILFTFALLFTSFSYVIVAETSFSNSTDSSTLESEQQIELLAPDEEFGTSTEPESIEILDRRDRNVKHFRHEDGSIEAIIYGYAVHRQDEDGNWQDIDNRLTDYTDGDTVYYVTDDARVRFSNSGIGQLTVTLDTKPYRVRMGMMTDGWRTGELSADPTVKPEIVVKNHLTRAEQAARTAVGLSRDAQIERLKEIDNRTELCYRNIQDGIHLKYELEADDLKETIIVNAPQNAYIYRFGLQLEGLIATLRSDGGIDLTDSETGEVPYRIPAPFMVDANDEISHQVSYVLESVGTDAYVLTVIADSEWMNDSNRAFPVSIDPSITTSVFTDTYIEDNHADSERGSDVDLWLGATKYSYLKTNLISTIPQKSEINYAYLYGYYYYYNTITSGDFYVGLYLGMQSWDESLTWNKAKKLPSMGFFPNKVYDTINLSGAAGAYYSSPVRFTLSMKEITQYWVNGSANHGIVLKRTSGNLMHAILVSNEGRTAYRPSMVISYTEPWIESGVYRLRNAETGLYLTVGGTSWKPGALIQQNAKSTAADNEEASRQQMFKINSIKNDNGDCYYTVRLMTNSSLSLTANSNKVTTVAISTTDSWSSIAQTERWLIKRDGIYVTLKNGVYITAPENTTQGASVVAKTQKSSYSKWVLERYTGATLEQVFLSSYFKPAINVGETYSFAGFMYSSTLGVNGPVTFSVENRRFGTITRASMTASGTFRALAPGKVAVIASFDKTASGTEEPYSGVFYRWIKFSRREVYLQNQTDTNKYMQTNEKDNAIVKDDGSGIIGKSLTYGKYQKWEIIPIQGTEYYIIKNKATQKVLTVPEGSAESDGVQLTQTEYRKLPNQEWEIDLVRSERYIIRPRLNPEQMCVAPKNFGEVIAQRVCLTNNSSYREEWKLRDVSELKATKKIRFYYDPQVIGDKFPSEADLQEFIEDVLKIMEDDFNLKLEIDRISPSSLLEWTPETPGCYASEKKDPCTSQCGHFADCARDHHKSADRLCNLPMDSATDGEVDFVCRIVDYVMCDYNSQDGSHTTRVLGCGKCNGKDSILTFYNASEDTMRCVLYHELLHNLGAAHCNDSDCVLFSENTEKTDLCNYHILQVAKLLSQKGWYQS